MTDTMTDPLYHDVTWKIDYRVRLGVAWSRFMRGLQHRELWASTCHSCERTFVPPQSYCERCYEPVDDWSQREPIGTLGASTIVYQGFDGGPTAPYAVGAIHIDGTDTQLMHFVGGLDLSDVGRAREQLRAGTRVRGVWADVRTAAITDLAYFAIEP